MIKIRAILSFPRGPMGPAVYGDPVATPGVLSVNSGQSVTVAISLSKKPNVDQTISLSVESDLITLDKSQLSFTPDNWNVEQTVTLTAETTEEDITTTLVMKNSDELMTDYGVFLTIKASTYNPADTYSFPANAHVATVDDFESVMAIAGNGIILGKYNGTYTNLEIPSSMVKDGVTYSPVYVSGPTFTDNTTVQYVNIKDGVSFTQAATTFVSKMFYENFSGCTALIGARIPIPTNLNDVSMSQMFNGCSALKWVLNIENLQNVGSFQQMFYGCSSLEYVQDLSTITTTRSTTNNYQDGKAIFSNCTSLKRVYGLPDLTNMTDAFNGCSALEQAIVPATVGHYEIEFQGGHSNASYAVRCFNGCTKLKKLTILNKDAIPDLPTTFDNPCEIYVKDSGMKESIKNATNTKANVTVLDYGSSADASMIVIWGDSTSSPATPWKEWPKRLEEKVSGFTFKNQAFSGEFTTSTSARQGGNGLTVSAFTIPADTTAVDITLKSADGHTFGSWPAFSGGGSFNPCTIAGVDGVISKKSDSGAYQFTRMTAGTVVSVPADSAVTSKSDASLNAADNIMLINMGANSGWDEDADVLIGQIDKMVQHFGGTKYIVSGPWGGKHLRTEANRQVVQTFETKAAAKWGDHWLNMRQYMIDNGLSDNNLTATTFDTQRMALGQAPASLLGGGTETDIGQLTETAGDDVHPNVYGANSMCLAFYKKGKALGYWD